jgi:hypothetical protein
MLMTDIELRRATPLAGLAAEQLQLPGQRECDKWRMPRWPDRYCLLVGVGSRTGDHPFIGGRTGRSVIPTDLRAVV